MAGGRERERSNILKPGVSQIGSSQTEDSQRMCLLAGECSFWKILDSERQNHLPHVSRMLVPSLTTFAGEKERRVSEAHLVGI